MQRIPFSEVPNRLLTAFGRWFPASAGVWQTFIAVGALTIMENTGIVLGYVNRIDTARADAVLKQMQELMVSIQAQESEELEILRARVQELNGNVQEDTP